MLKSVTLNNPNITKLDLSDMNWKVIPEDTFKLKNLRKLKLCNNKLVKIPIDICKLKNLENINLSNNQISSVYAKIFQLKKLKTLILNKNKLLTIPKQISLLTKIRILGIAHNNLKSLNDQFGTLSTLKELNISNNKFKVFPKEIYNLKGLRSLWCRGNEFKDFSAKEISNSNPNLEKIFCYNPIVNNACSNDYKELSKIKGNAIMKLIELSKINTATKTMSQEKEIKVDSDKIKCNIFISYSHEDSIWLKKVKTHLKALKFSNDKFDVWDDTRINSGEKWKDEIEKSLNKAKIAILLISTNFLASDFIQNDELPTLLKAAEEKGTIIMPLIIKHSRFTRYKKLSVFLAVNETEKPLDSLTDSQVDKELVNLTNEIEKHL